MMKSKKELVYEKLRSQIIACQLQPGEPINEAEFAERFGVSKTPIREAIRQLDREGLVDSIPGRGSIISYISSGDIYETFEIREIIECGAARLAAKLTNKERLIKKRDELKELKGKLTAEDEPQHWNDYNDIHAEIIDSVANKRLSKMYREILDNIERIRNNFGHRFSGRRVEHIIEEHID
ncbi:MAG TPA: GntR family transcriptional regulator, partial [Sediminispirochaeta sp.]|nr:GntR family transcriptional regulator [Sediminispirochaeta sp.]